MNGSVSLVDLEKKWSVNRRTLYRWIRDGRLQWLQTPGGHYRIAEEEVVRFEREMLSRSSPVKKQTQQFDQSCDVIGVNGNLTSTMVENADGLAIV